MGYFKSMLTDRQEAKRLRWVPATREQASISILPDHLEILERFCGPDHVVRAPDYNVCGPDCIGCGGLGYTIEQSEDGECTVSCREGWERAMDRAAMEEYFS